MEQESEIFLLKEGCIKTFQSLAAIQMYPDKDKHSEADKKIPPRIRSRGNGLRPACHSIGDGYVRGRTSGKNSDEQSLTSQVDFGWALWKTQKTATFSQKAKNYLLDVCWTGEETSKVTTSNVTSQISSLSDDTNQKCCLRPTGWYSSKSLDISASYLP